MCTSTREPSIPAHANEWCGGSVNWFTYGGNTYVVEDNGAGATFGNGDIVIKLRERLSQFEQWKRERVQRDPQILSSEPTFKGTRLSVRHIGSMLLRGAPAEEVTDDYPYLSSEDLEFAKLFTAAYPPRGRPRESCKAYR